MPVVRENVDLLFIRVAKATLGTDEVWASFQDSDNYPAVVYYLTGVESVQTLKRQKDFTYTLRYEVRAKSYKETIDIDLAIRKALDETHPRRLVSVQGVFDDPSDRNPLAGPEKGLFRRFRTVEIRA